MIMYEWPVQAVFISGIFDIPSIWSCIKAITHEVDCIQAFCHLLFLLVVDLPNSSDFPKPVGNTAIQYFLSMRHSRIVLCYCFNSSMPNSGKISVEALSIISHGGCHVFFTQHRKHGESSSLIGCSAKSILFLIG